MRTTTTAPPVKAPRVTGTILEALLAQRGGYVVQDCTAGTGVVYAIETLTDAQLNDPDFLVLLDYAEAAERIHRDGGTTAAARSLTAIYANATARGLL